MPDKKKSIKEILKELRKNKTAALEKHSHDYGVTASTITAIVAAQINKRFDKMESHGDYPFWTIRRKDIIHHFGPNSTIDRKGQPTLKHSIRERLRAYGISAHHKRGLVEFIRIKPKKNPQI